MKKNIFLLVFTLHLFFVRSEEGMLIPSVIAAFENDMKAMGMKLSAEDLYSINKASIKDAIIHFGGGCTAEIVSDKGLLLTNHHCGYSQIQSHSSLENDYLKNGFWAKTFGEELPNPGLTAARIVRIDDVTAGILKGTESTKSLKEKMQIIEANSKELSKKLTEGTRYNCEIKAFDYGNSYYALITEVFKDVRLVGTPPNAIGKFGGDTDNWVWPRHTGDFSVFRIYANTKNEPAEYSKENVPYKPLHFLPIAAGDKKQGEFTMVYGFPGQTEQHLVSSQIQYLIERERPARIAMREQSLSVIDAGMRASDKIRIQYAAKQAGIANAYKKWIGQVDGLERLDAVKVKENAEAIYTKTAESNEEWNKKYGKVVPTMQQMVADYIEYDFAYAMTVEYLYVGPELYKQVRNLQDLAVNYQKYEADGQLDAMIEKYKNSATGFFKNYDASIDRQIFEKLHKEFVSRIGVYEHLIDPSIKTANVEALSKAIYSKSIFTDEQRLKSFLDHFNAKSIAKLKKDPAYSLYEKIIGMYIEKVVPNLRDFYTQMDNQLKIYVEGKQVMFPDAKHWPDANSTLRITYGKLEGSVPRDGMTYVEHTTTDGIIEKNRTGNPDFELLPGMLELYQKKEFGEYAQDGELWVCFTGSNHTTGGNSGSPVLNGEGHLMGLNFDRSWESTMSDYMFDPSRCRNIVVDIRYVLWVIDKYAGAKYLVEEMKLVK